MAKKTTRPNAAKAFREANPMVAATLAGIIYQTKLFNRQARVTVPEEEVVIEVVSLWRIVMNALNSDTAPGV
jgi:hypothetical protein